MISIQLQMYTMYSAVIHFAFGGQDIVYANDIISYPELHSFYLCPNAFELLLWLPVFFLAISELSFDYEY